MARPWYSVIHHDRGGSDRQAPCQLLRREHIPRRHNYHLAIHRSHRPVDGTLNLPAASHHPPADLRGRQETVFNAGYYKRA